MDIKTRIENCSSEFTATERRLSSMILMDYPFAALLPIQELARNSKTSAPTVSRFVAKLGFTGFQEFQRRLIDELKEGMRSPVEVQRNSKPLEGAYLEGFLSRVEDILQDTVSAVPEVQFEKICAVLNDPKSNIYVIGGRISDALALYLSRHLRQIRGKVFHLPSDPEAWPEYLLRMHQRDVFVVVDFRRYQSSIAALAKRARRERGAKVVLITDRWISPIAEDASEVLAVPIDSGTLWDSYSGALAVIEAIVTKVAEYDWEQSRARIEAWDDTRFDFGERHEEDD